MNYEHVQLFSCFTNMNYRYISRLKNTKDLIRGARRCWMMAQVVATRILNPAEPHAVASQNVCQLQTLPTPMIQFPKPKVLVRKSFQHSSTKIHSNVDWRGLKPKQLWNIEVDWSKNNQESTSKTLFSSRCYSLILKQMANIWSKYAQHVFFELISNSLLTHKRWCIGK